MAGRSHSPGSLSDDAGGYGDFKRMDGKNHEKNLSGNILSAERGALGDSRIPHPIDPLPFLGAFYFLGFRLVLAQEFCQLIAVDPDFVISLLLRLIKN